MEVENPRIKPSVHLTTVLTDLTVDDEPPTKEIYLLDQHLIRIGHSNDQYRLHWENFNVYHIKLHNDSSHGQLIKMGQKYGFHVVKQVKETETTHFYLSSSNQEVAINISKHLIAALILQLPFITEEWADKLALTHDQGFELKSFNNSLQRIIEDNYGPLQKPAIFGPDKRRKILFQNLDFWFFDEEQYKSKKYYIERAGGKAGLYTFEDAFELAIHPGTLFVQIPYESEAWEPIRDRFCVEQDVVRTILDFEIFFSIIYCSTNVMCNPSANLREHILPNDPVYASLSASYTSISTSVYSPSCQIKTEPMVTNSLADTLPINYDDVDIKVKEEHVFHEFSHSGDKNIVLNDKSSLTLEAMDEDEEKYEPNTCSYNVNDNDEIGPSTLDSMELPSNMNNMNDFFDEIFPVVSIPSKNKKQKEAELQARKCEHSLQEREQEETKFKRQKCEKILQHEEEKTSQDELPQQEEDKVRTYIKPVMQNYTQNMNDNSEEKFTKIAFAPLVVRPKPKSKPKQRQQRPEHEEVNYKRFKKVHPIQSNYLTDVIHLATNSRVFNNDRANQRQFTSMSVVRIQDTDGLDVDVTIRPTITRRRGVKHCVPSIQDEGLNTMEGG
ncbi:MAG: hypothetical protein EXX96DRAFT_619347 [Benjaminiella poitrasii]|nr:MAG: hypothetical protein EXX96DRAFT_619347 [Benjaminiella poitrasii]